MSQTPALAPETQQLVQTDRVAWFASVTLCSITLSICILTLRFTDTFWRWYGSTWEGDKSKPLAALALRRESLFSYDCYVKQWPCWSLSKKELLNELSRKEVPPNKELGWCFLLCPEWVSAADVMRSVLKRDQTVPVGPQPEYQENIQSVCLGRRAGLLGVHEFRCLSC